MCSIYSVVMSAHELSSTKNSDYSNLESDVMQGTVNIAPTKDDAAATSAAANGASTSRTRRRKKITGTPSPNGESLKKNEAKLDDELDVSLPKTVHMTDIKTLTNVSLRHGMLVKNKERGPGGRYVVIPKGWRRSDETYLDEIFAALRIATPPLIFRTDKCPVLFPKVGLVRDYSENNKDPYSSFKIKYDNPTKEEIDLFSIVMNSRMKTCMEEISHACAQCNAVFMMFRPSSSNVIDKMITDSLSEGGIALGVLDKSHILTPEMFRLMIDNAVPHTEEILNATAWNASTKVDANGHIRPNVNIDLTHILLFEDIDDKTYFAEFVERVIPIGLLCGGGTMPLYDSSVRALASGTPLFVFKHTVLAGHCLSSLLEYHNDTYHSKKALADVTSIQERLGPQEGNIHGVQAEMRAHAIGLAHNWPDGFNAHSVLHIDLLTDKPKRLLMGIVNVMASVYGSTVELGGVQAEKDALQYAWALYRHLHSLERHQRFVAVFLRTLMTILGFLTTCVASASMYIQLNESAKYEGTVLKVLKAGNVALPILLGICVTVYTAFTPVTKWANLAAAKAKVLSEIFRYMCRVGEYKGGRGVSDHRIAFSQKLQAIWESVASSDVVGKFNNTKGVGIRSDRMEEMMYKFARPEWVPQYGTEKGKASISPELGHALDKDILADKSNAPSSVKSSSMNPDTDDDDESDVHEKSYEFMSKQVPGVHAMSGEEYIRNRLKPEMGKLVRQTPAVNRFLTTFQVIVIICSSAGAVMTMYNLEIWIPVVLAFSHMLEVTITFRQWPLRYQRNSHSFVRLKQILLWWNGLTLIQQRVPFYKNQLVDQVENLLMSEVEMITQAQMKKEESVNGTEADVDKPKSEGSSAVSSTGTTTKPSS